MQVSVLYTERCVVSHHEACNYWLKFRKDIKVGTLVYFIKEAVRGFYQAKLMTFVSIISIAVSLFFMNVVIVTFLNFEHVIRKSTDQADIAVYLKDAVKDKSDELDDIIDKVSTLDQVRRVVVIGKDSAWDRFAESYGKEMLEAIDDNPLPVSLELYLKEQNRSPADVDSLTLVLKAYDGVESVSYSKEWLSLVERFQFFFWCAVAIIAVLLNFILYFMIANTIKLTIYARKDLVSHMQMVGATEFFIKMPFILEGMLQGCIGGIVCSIFIAGIHAVLSGLSIYWGPQSSLFLITVSAGILYGWLGSMGAVRKFLV